jgi:hypothetical protein
MDKIPISFRLGERLIDGATILFYFPVGHHLTSLSALAFWPGM